MCWRMTYADDVLPRHGAEPCRDQNETDPSNDPYCAKEKKKNFPKDEEEKSDQGAHWSGEERSAVSRLRLISAKLKWLKYNALVEA